MMGLGMGLGLLFFLVVSGVLILGGVWLVRALFQSGQASPPPGGATQGTARQILDQRYARGEISREEYETIRRDLEG